MLYKTKGIVFRSIKYSETSIIAKVFTKDFGLQSFIINGVRNRGSKNKAALFQPLHMLELEAYHKENRDLQRLKEFKTNYVFRSLPYSMHKSSVALFLAEILNKVIKEEESNPELYQFLESTIVNLDDSKEPDSNFHLTFLLQLTQYLGFYPQGTFSDANSFFDLKEGYFVSEKPVHPYFFDQPLSHLFNQMINDEKLSFNLMERNQILEKLLEYYRLHLTDFKEIKSHKILHQVLSP